MKNQFTSISAPISVNLQITDKCNFKCFFCFNNFGTPVDTENRSREMIRDDLYKILDALALSGVFEIRLFGGEFTFFKYWRDVLLYANKKGFFISFVSNGYLISKEDIELFTFCGIKQCSISLHGLECVHDAVTMHKGSYNRVIQSIEQLTNAGIRVSIILTPNERNIDHIYDFVKFMNQVKGIKDFCINRLFVSDKYKNLEHSDYIKILTCIDKCYKEFGVNITLGDSIPRCVIPLKYWKYLSYCSKGVAFAQVDSKGDVRHCSATNSTLGNCLEENLRIIWQEKLCKFRELDYLPTSCKYCPIFCGGGCLSSRSMDDGFQPDQFITLPSDESSVSGIIKIIRNWIRGKYFGIFLNKKSVDKSSMGNYPKITRRYKIRKEIDGSYLALFEFSGIKTLTPLAVEILEQMDGKNTITDIVSICMRNGNKCTKDDVITIFQSLNKN